ncbi:MAG: hypothetical protein KAI24_08085 [Planctomycetes bacterium]|nr:hypothetical protein [Planctomycetota bacterium]
MNGLAEQYEDKMDFEVVSTKDPGAAERIEQIGFEIHGMVITDEADRILWKEEGHMMKEPAVKAQIEKLLNG